MQTAKPAKTLADYLVIAISPALVIVLVHSICFFLIDVFYRGEAVGSVRWVMFWFVLAVVLIARIGIEQGDAHAIGYGIALAIVTWIYLTTVHPNIIFGAILLAVVWFTAHKITSNCTLVDDEADESGRGLLQPLRHLSEFFKQLRPGSPVIPPPEATAAKALHVPPSEKTPRPATVSKPRGKSPVPGIWLIYFSLASLPLFGLGQPLLPAGDFAARHRAFVFLFFYLAASLGLLITTSFLGLRRYLRQRYLTMPPGVAFGWIQIGVLSASAVLCLALLFPRPGATEAWGVLRYHVDYQLRRASQYAARFNPHGSGQGRAGQETSAGGQPINPSAPSGETTGKDESASSHKSDSPPSDSAARPSGQEGTSHNGQSPLGAGSGETERQKSVQPNSPGTPDAGRAGTSGDSTGDFTEPAAFLRVKFLFYLVLALCVCWLACRYRLAILDFLRAVAAVFRQFIAALRNLFVHSQAAAAASRKTTPPPFRAFKSPFLTGADRVMPPEELIMYTYDALRSWAAGVQPPADLPETPREFCRRIAADVPQLSEALGHLAFSYGHVAYGSTVPASFQSEQLRPLWHEMASPFPPFSSSSESQHVIIINHALFV